jgi:uncharacterized protein YjbI with pentapeptide repeats
LEIDEVRRKQDKELDDRQYEMEQKQTDDLHYQGILKSYIDDISNALFKMNQTFKSDKMKYSYIGCKTLTALRSLDSKRKPFLFLFQYETKLLLSLTADKSRSFDVSNFDLNGISVVQSVSDHYVFESISLLFVLLVNATFIKSVFKEADFERASMEYASFKQCEFYNGVDFA